MARYIERPDKVYRRIRYIQKRQSLFWSCCHRLGRKGWSDFSFRSVNITRSIKKGIVQTGISAVVLMVTAVYGHADTFVLVTGEQFGGTIVRSLGNSLTIKLDDAGMKQLPLSDIVTIELVLADGTQIGGRLSSWFDGTYVILHQGQDLIEIRDGISTKIIVNNARPFSGEEQREIVPTLTVQPTM